jgi:hypothetical protein
MRTVSHLCDVYPGICLTTEEKARKNLSQVSRRMSVGTMKTEYTEQSKNKNITIFIYFINTNNEICFLRFAIPVV